MNRSWYAVKENILGGRNSSKSFRNKNMLVMFKEYLGVTCIWCWGRVTGDEIRKVVGVWFIWLEGLLWCLG